MPRVFIATDYTELPHHSPSHIRWTDFIYFANGKTLFETWLTMPLTLMLSPNCYMCRILDPICHIRIQPDDIRELARNNPSLFSATALPTIISKCREYKRLLRRVDADSSVWSAANADLVSTISAVAPDATPRLTRLLKDTYCPFRRFEGRVVERYRHIFVKATPEELIKDALRLGDWASVRKAEEELLDVSQINLELLNPASPEPGGVL